MKLTIDFTEKTIIVLEDVHIQELIDVLILSVPGYQDFTLKVNTLNFVTAPFTPYIPIRIPHYIPSPARPYDPWIIYSTGTNNVGIFDENNQIQGIYNVDTIYDKTL